MAYHLLTYSLIFLPVVIALYQLCPARFRFVVLLAADYTFFCMISGKLLVWLLLATLVTYGTGRWLAAIPVRHSDLHGKALTRKKRGVLALGIVLILGALVTLKYLRVFGVTLAAPIGISYYSLQAISYMTDVYRGTQESCKNPVKVALYLSFFPQIMEGVQQLQQFRWCGNLSRGACIHVAALYGVFRMHGYHHGKRRNLQCAVA